MFGKFSAILMLVCGTGFINAQINHKLNVNLNPPGHSINVSDEVTIPADKVEPVLYFLMNGNLEVKQGSGSFSLKLEQKNAKGEDSGMDREEFDQSSGLSLNKYSVTFPAGTTGEQRIVFTYSGVINYPIEQLGEEYARGFSQTPGIIDEKGVYLAGSSYWIPRFDDNLITFEMTTTVQNPWDVVSQGKRTLHEIQNGNRTVTWSETHPTEEAYLIAAKFTEYSASAGAIDVMAFLRTPDETLANKYLEATSQYLEMYRKLVGPYPFSKFALVENFWETGYGMPSFTLLGEQIIRFPFILNSSYPHELLHNYWGNSVYVDFKSGNWCEGITAYMADHLISEQRGQGEEYRRTTLQKYTDYVNESNDFPLNKFISRTNPSSEAVGYGKSLMMWNMLRDKAGDENFTKAFQKFFRDYKFKMASFADIRTEFETVTGMDLKPFFEQWVDRTGAPELSITGVTVTKNSDGYHLSFALNQIQKEEAFDLDVPVAVSFAKKAEMIKVSMNGKEQKYELDFKDEPLMLQVDPQLSIFRKLNYNEIPPSLSKIFGSEKITIILPSEAAAERLAYYKQLAGLWGEDKSKSIEVKSDDQLNSLPADRSVWIFGIENKFASPVKEGLKDYDAELTGSFVRFGKSSYDLSKNSVIIAVRHPQNHDQVAVLLTADNKDAVPGLSRKLPHYGKYSYLVFEGTEPTNTGKGEWESVNSPLIAKIRTDEKAEPFASLPKRRALAELAPVFSAERMMKTVEFLAGDQLEGRGPGSEGIKKAAEFIAAKFKEAGLMPGSDDGTYFQTWDEIINSKGDKAPVSNVIGIIPGTNPELSGQSVVVCAHYDHLGLGWPGVSPANMGRIHPGADDNASGVAVMLEMAQLLGKSLKPQRTVIFVAFTNEESGLLGSKHYVKFEKKFPADKIIGVLNFDTVGRLGDKKLLVLNTSSAREWRFIFMGAGYVTGVDSEMPTQDIDASDQKSFIEAGIPAVKFTSGANADYHKPSDTPDKIDANGLVKVATFAREGVLYLADRTDAMAFTGQTAPVQKPSAKAASGERKVSTGSIPDFAYSGEGVRIGGFSPDSPAEKAGLKTGDIIFKLGDNKITNLMEYSNALKLYKPGDSVDVLIIRDGKELKLKLELTAK